MSQFVPGAAAQTSVVLRGWLAIAVILIATVTCVFISPPFEGPDEAGFRLPVLLGQSGSQPGGAEGYAIRGVGRVAATLGVNSAVVVRCGRELGLNSRFAFGANTPVMVHRNVCPAADYLKLKATIAFVLIGSFCLIFRADPLMLASIAFPSVFFYTTQISTDAVNAILSLVAGYLALRNRSLLLLPIALVGLLIDRSAVALLAFAFTIIGCDLVRPVKRMFASRVGPLIGLGVGLAIGMTVRLTAGRLTALATFYLTVVSNSQFGTNPIRQAGALFLSSWYLGGSMSFTAFYVEYVLFAALLASIYLAPRSWFGLPPETLDRIRLIVSSTVVVMATIVTIIQPLTQARYYMFFVPAVVRAMAGIFKAEPSALVLPFLGLNISYALSAAAAAS